MWLYTFAMEMFRPLQLVNACIYIYICVCVKNMDPLSGFILNMSHHLNIIQRV